MLVFFFTDIEGSTRLWEKHTQEMGGVISRHDAILQEQIGAFGGRITKHIGDGVTCQIFANIRYFAIVALIADSNQCGGVREHETLRANLLRRSEGGWLLLSLHSQLNRMCL